MAQSQSGILEMDTVFTILSDTTQRSLLWYLSDVEQATVRELTAHLASSNDGGDRHHESRRQAHVTLVHDHLPRLAADGVVDYDRSANDVTIGPNFDEVEPFVSRLEDADIDPVE
ncbi:DUF7344 domain-containing protein [Natrinema amylolyticum]|uniref:DUF7344 domain-containing protein n=1 Tax=Natrinema amylolyticum TaxID=2878679 RepID=UPI001CFAD52F|nr:hypothetical protein [Natrinema amylolyticum]